MKNPPLTNQQATPAMLRGIASREMPHAFEAEAYVVGAMILDKAVVTEIRTIIEASTDFYHTPHRLIYEVICQAHSNDEPIEVANLVHRLEEGKMLRAVGGADYLIELGESVAVTSTAPHYAKLVREAARKRANISVMIEAISSAWESSPDENAAGLISTLSKFQAGTDRRSDQTIAEIAEEVLAESLKPLDPTETVTTGIRSLDDILGPILPGELVSIGGCTSMGKSALSQQIAEYNASQGVSTGIFSLEMSRQAIGQRTLSTAGGIPIQAFRRRNLTEGQVGTLNQSIRDMAMWPLYVCDAGGLKPSSIEAQARAWQQSKGVKLIVIDYLQNAVPERSTREYEDVTNNAKAIFHIAKRLKISTLLVSQLNRDTQHREGNRPKKSDFRGSGAIEESCDALIAVHRPDYYEREKDPTHVDNGAAELIVLKNRGGGQLGTANAYFDGRTFR